MPREYKPIDLRGLRTYGVGERHHKSSLAEFALLPEPGASAAELLNSFPQHLGASAFRKIVSAVAAAAQHQRPVVVAFGAHLIKVGCGPILIDLIRRGIVKAIACNGACAIHDLEIATLGQTSEEVAQTIRDGTFGMVAETMAFFDDAVDSAQKNQIGLGAAVGRLIVDRTSQHKAHSVFAAAWEAKIPACVHVAVGTDTVHASSRADGASLGAATLHDFRLICDVVSDLGATDSSGVGGVWLNVGSAVVLPEVFLKAVSVARNLGANLDAMTTANLDMIRHYRPRQNVLTRPVTPGRGYEVVGQHEILLPLFRQAVVEELAQTDRRR